MSLLPDKPSALIRVALADLAKVEAMPEVYRIDMDLAYHDNRAFLGKGKCVVCLAGSVMAMSLSTSPAAIRYPSDFGHTAGGRLDALDCFRGGRIQKGVELMMDIDTELNMDRPITPYHDDPAAFCGEMERLAADLEKAGL